MVIKVVLLTISSLILTHALYAQGCFTSFDLFLDRGIKRELIESGRALYTPKEMLRLLEVYSEIETRNIPLIDLISMINSSKIHTAKELRLKLLFALTLRDEEQKEFLSNLSLPFTKQKTFKEKIGFLSLEQRFQRDSELFLAKESEHYADRLKQLEKKGRDPVLAQKQAKEETSIWLSKYEKVFYGCRANKVTPAHKVAANRMKLFTVGLGATSGTFAYWQTHKEQEKDWRWYSEVGFTLTWDIIGELLKTKLLSNPSTTFLEKAAAKYIQSRKIDIIRSTSYQLLLGVKDAELEKRFLEIKNSEEEIAKLEEMMVVLTRPQMIDKILRKFVDLTAEVKAMVKNDPTLANLKYDDVDWTNITMKDLERPEIKRLIIEAISMSRYEAKMGAIHTGSVGLDRMTFHALYGAVMLPKDIAYGLFIYRILCLGQLNPQKAFVQALVAYAANVVISDQLYYRIRKNSVGQ